MRRWPAEERRAWLAAGQRGLWSTDGPDGTGAPDRVHRSPPPEAASGQDGPDRFGGRRGARADRTTDVARGHAATRRPRPRADLPAVGADRLGVHDDAGTPAYRDSGISGAAPAAGALRPLESRRLRTRGDDDDRPAQDIHPTTPTGGRPAPDAVAAAGVFGATAFDRPAGRLLDPGRRGLRALLVVAVVVLVVAAVLAWRARPSVEPVGDAPLPAAPVPGENVSGESLAAEPEAPPPSAAVEVVVSVTGRVTRPGLVRLPPGARVADAVAAAGGALPGTSTTYLNLARRVVDGELILVGITPSPGSGAAAPPPGSAAGSAPGGPVNLNTATVAELDALPGVGPVLAARLVAFRERSGGFRAVSDLRKVDGIGGTRFERLKPLVTV